MRLAVEPLRGGLPAGGGYAGAGTDPGSRNGVAVRSDADFPVPFGGFGRGGFGLGAAGGGYGGFGWVDPGGQYG